VVSLQLLLFLFFFFSNAFNSAGCAQICCARKYLWLILQHGLKPLTDHNWREALLCDDCHISVFKVEYPEYATSISDHTLAHLQRITVGYNFAKLDLNTAKRLFTVIPSARREKRANFLRRMLLESTQIDLHDRVKFAVDHVPIAHSLGLFLGLPEEVMEAMPYAKRLKNLRISADKGNDFADGVPPDGWEKLLADYCARHDCKIALREGIARLGPAVESEEVMKVLGPHIAYENADRDPLESWTLFTLLVKHAFVSYDFAKKGLLTKAEKEPTAPGGKYRLHRVGREVMAVLREKQALVYSQLAKHVFEAPPLVE
jgi:hypothetical protein